MSAGAFGFAGPRLVAADLLAGFPSALREAGLAIDPSRAINFLNAVRVSRLRGMSDLGRAGRVTLTASPDDFAIFDAVFKSWFGADPFVAEAAPDEEDDTPRAKSPQSEQPPEVLAGEAAGKAASEDELCAKKSFGRLRETDAEVLSRLKRRLTALPATRSRHWAPTPRGSRIDLARTCRAARSTFGETLRILQQSRPERPRKLLLLIDVSGSMKAQSEAYLRFAHLLTRERRKIETFCFGTRLTRITRTLKQRDPETALARLGDLVFDFDGGTRIGAALEEFLSVSRHASLVRGAVTIILSDGLERGDPAAMIHAVTRMARLSHRLVWATPLAADPRYRPLTRAMAGALPHLDGLFDASDLAALESMVWRLDAVEHNERGQAERPFQTSSKAA